MTAPLTWADQRAIEAASRKAWLQSIAPLGPKVAAKRVGIQVSQIKRLAEKAGVTELVPQ